MKALKRKVAFKLGVDVYSANVTLQKEINDISYASFAGGLATLVGFHLETGRTHQIRVHFASIHRPVLGDPLYGPKRPRSSFGLKRQFLHAYELGFVLPSTGEWRTFTAPLPGDLRAALDKLRAAGR